MTEEAAKERPKYYKWMNPSVEHLPAEIIDSISVYLRYHTIGGY